MAHPRKKMTYVASLAVTFLALPGLSSANTVLAGFANIAVEDPAFTQLFSWFVIGTSAPAQQSITQNPNVLNLQFPITSGNSSNGVLTLGGGLHFIGQTTPKGVDSVLWVTDLVADITTQSLTGDVAINTGNPTTDVALFHNSVTGHLVMDDGLATELSTEFGIPDLTGTTLGTLVIAPAPEPGTLGLLGGASLLALGLLRRRRDMLGLLWRKGRIQSAERVEAHLSN